MHGTDPEAHIYAGREFVIEGDRIPTERVDGVLLTDGSRHEIAKGHIDREEGIPIVTWENGSGKCEKKYPSIFGMRDDFPDATHVLFPGTDTQGEVIHPLRFDFM